MEATGAASEGLGGIPIPLVASMVHGAAITIISNDIVLAADQVYYYSGVIAQSPLTNSLNVVLNGIPIRSFPLDEGNNNSFNGLVMVPSGPAGIFQLVLVGPFELAVVVAVTILQIP